MSLLKRSKDINISALVWNKTNGICWYCGKLMNPFLNFSIDHILPKSRGGMNDIRNLVPCCLPCNHRKRNKTIEEFREYLQNKKIPPFTKSQISVIENCGIPKEEITKKIPKVEFWFENYFEVPLDKALNNGHLKQLLKGKPIFLSWTSLRTIINKLKLIITDLKEKNTELEVRFEDMKDEKLDFKGAYEYYKDMFTIIKDKTKQNIHNLELYKNNLESLIEETWKKLNNCKHKFSNGKEINKFLDSISELHTLKIAHNKLPKCPEDNIDYVIEHIFDYL